MLCCPGFTPVWKVDHATGEMGGLVVCSGRKVPWSRSRARCGSLPSFMYLVASSGSIPSSPSTTSRFTFARV